MNLRLFQELMELNLAFEQVIRGLQRMEKVHLFHSDIVRVSRADVEVDRQFFDNFDEIVEDDALWAYKFQREYNKKMKDPDDLYLEIKDSEERRKKKGLPPSSDSPWLGYVRRRALRRGASQKANPK